MKGYSMKLINKLTAVSSFIVATTIVAAVASSAVAQTAGGGKTIVIATQSVGSSAYARAAAYKAVIDPALPAGYKLEIQTTSSGGVASALLVEVGKADMGLSNNLPSKRLLEGKQDPNRPPMTHVAGIIGGTDFITMTVMFTDDFVKKSGFTTMEDVIKNKYPARIVTKAPGSFGIAGAIDLLDSMGGLKFADIKSWGGQTFHIDPKQMVDMLKEGRADISIDTVSLQQPAFQELTLTTKMHVIELSQNTRDKLLGYGYVSRPTPAGNWGGQTKEIQSVAGTENLVVRKDLPDDVVYAITKALLTGKDKMAALMPAMGVFEPAKAGRLDYLGIPLHPGAAKYYKEVGYVK